MFNKFEQQLNPLKTFTIYFIEMLQIILIIIIYDVAKWIFDGFYCNEIVW